MKMILVGLALALLGVQAHASGAVGARGGKKAVSRFLDNSGNPLQIGDDKPWKVFESTGGAVPVMLVDEAGVAPKQGMIHQICISTTATTVWAVAYDTSSVTSASLVTSIGLKIAPPLFGGTTTMLCTPILNALFTSGCAVETQSAIPPDGGVYVYWRELGGYK